MIFYVALWGTIATNCFFQKLWLVTVPEGRTVVEHSNSLSNLKHRNCKSSYWFAAEIGEKVFICNHVAEVIVL